MYLSRPVAIGVLVVLAAVALLVAAYLFVSAPGYVRPMFKP